MSFLIIIGKLVNLILKYYFYIELIAIQTRLRPKNTLVCKLQIIALRHPQVFCARQFVPFRSTSVKYKYLTLVQAGIKWENPLLTVFFSHFTLYKPCSLALIYLFFAFPNGEKMREQCACGNIVVAKTSINSVIEYI